MDASVHCNKVAGAQRVNKPFVVHDESRWMLEGFILGAGLEEGEVQHGQAKVRQAQVQVEVQVEEHKVKLGFGDVGG